MKTTGLDYTTAHSIPAGATVNKITYQAPGSYGEGTYFDTLIEAVEDAITRKKAARSRFGEGYPFSEHMWVDTRWEMSWPPNAGLHTSGIDFGVSRIEFDDIADAEAYLKRALR